MMRGRAFKAQYRLHPLRSGTPPPPREFFEPLSPVLPSGAPSFSASANDNNSDHLNNGINGAPAYGLAYPQLDADHPQYPPASVPVVAPIPAALLPPPPKAQLSPALGSPIDALANAAVSSLAASPVYADPIHRSVRAPVSPSAAAPHSHQTERGTKHRYPDDAVYTYAERPAKRARSEFFPSPHSRPATSHVSSYPWSYNVEQMADNGNRPHQNSALSVAPPEDTSSRLSEAELLLYLRHSGSSHSTSYQSQTIPAKRWSVSYPEVPAPHSLQQLEDKHERIPGAHMESNIYDDALRLAHYSRGQTVDQHPNETVSAPLASAAQTHTPPEESFNATIPQTLPDLDNETEVKKPKKHQGWPKGKPRGPRTGNPSGKKKKPVTKTRTAASGVSADVPEQLYSPQSLPTDAPEIISTENVPQAIEPEQLLPEPVSQVRRHSISNLPLPESAIDPASGVFDISRARSVPLDNNMTVTTSDDGPIAGTQQRSDGHSQLTVCAGCQSSSSVTAIEESQQWISCDGCKGWFHFACAGFKTEREVRDVDKFFCEVCSPQFGQTTRVRKSGRAHTAVDYAGLNEGILKTSGDNPEHHYIASFKNGDIQFTPETFARIPPEFVTAEFFEKTNGFREPVVIPAALNPRPVFRDLSWDKPEGEGNHTQHHNYDRELFDLVQNDGQDSIDMVIPEGLTVRRVADLYGPTEKVDVIDVKSQEGDKRWTMAKWADYYEQEGEKPVRNVISLEVSQSKLGRLIRRPKAVRDMDLQDSIWPEDDKINAPKVQFYCLMSVADCYTDFHIDFGGSSVYYHIIKGKKTFFFIAPTKQNLKKYEDWCLSPKQSQEFLGQDVKECYRVDLSAGDTMLIPSGWIHAVWTPEDSLVIGGNFLTRIHYDMQIRVAEIEKNTKVAKKFRYPFFQKLMWLSVLKYLEEDPLPQSVAECLLSGVQFRREVPIYCQPNNFGHNSLPGPEHYNARYYSKAELEGLTPLANYIWRTVMISLGRIEGITQTTRNAVTRSIPKGRGEPLVLARQFAMWAAWKKGNEDIPQWAHPETVLPEASDNKNEKKLSAAQVRRMERESLSEAFRASHDQRATRSRQEWAETPTLPPPEVSTPGPSRSSIDLGKHLSTPKTSQLGPKRIACDACRKRRIRCKHKETIAQWDLSAKKSEGNPLILDGSNGVSVVSSPVGKSSASVNMTPSGYHITSDNSHTRREGEAEAPIPLSAGGPDVIAMINGADVGGDGQSNKSGRVKACADCRKSKRRCIHDENGNVDPVKASEAPIPRGSASKKRRVSEEDSETLSRRLKQEEALTSHNIFSQDEISPRHLKSSQSNPDRAFAWPSQISDIPDSITVLSHEKPGDQHSTEVVMVIDKSVELPRKQLSIVTSMPASDAIVSSIEHHLVGDQSLRDRAPKEGGELADISANTGPSSPLTELARSASPMHNHGSIVAPVTTPRTIPRASRLGSSGHKPVQTPVTLNRKSTTPRSGGTGKNRRDSKSFAKVDAKVRAVPTSPLDDQASLKLALQLQQEEHGLRRRSK